MKLLVAVTIMMEQDLNERAEIIYRWIQVAIDTKTAMGNLYSFTGIMLGLCLPEVSPLEACKKHSMFTVSLLPLKWSSFSVL